MPAQTPRPYQVSGISKITGAWRRGARKVLGVSPVGSGKTTLFSILTRDFALRLNSPVVILVHRRELAQQAANRLVEFEVPFGMILPGFQPKPYRTVQICSVQTLVRRKPPPARLVICDEAHLSTANTWAKVLEHYPNSLILGTTATPWRLSGKPLAGAYDASIVVATPAELREQGHLCPYVGFSFKTPDLSNVKTTGGDYNEKQSAEAMCEPSIVANVVERWQEHASELSTVVFAVTVEHSKELCAQFRAAGVAAEHLDGQTPTHERAQILKRVDSGETRVLCNVGVAAEGLDIPRLKCCVLARPTKSLARYIQMVGRVRRPWNGVKARIHDHCFALRTHGLPDDDRDYTLQAKPEEIKAPTQCPKCFAYYRGARCPECEHTPVEPTERQIVTVDDAELFEFSSDPVSAEIEKLPDAWKPKPEDLAPVDIRWGPETRGRAFTGRLLGVEEVERPWGVQRCWRLRGDRRVYRLPSTSVLDGFMWGANPVSEPTIRVTYEGERMLQNGHTRHEFRFEVDDGA